MGFYQTLPSGFKIPAIGFGTAFRGPEFADSLNAALETGYRHIDTAYIYKSEEAIGGVLKQWFDSNKLKRNDIFITSKIIPDKADNLKDIITQTLKDLQVEYVDLYLIHHPCSTNEENVKLWKKLESLVDAGKTKYIGLSNFSVEQIEAILKAARIKPVNLQVQLHLYNQQKEIVEFCRKNDITVVAYSPLGSPGRKSLNILDDEALKTIAGKYGKSPAQICLRFLIQKGIVPIPKSSNIERQKENFEVFDFTITDEDVVVLEGLDRKEFIKFRPPPKKE